jgi:hypothetical protein
MSPTAEYRENSNSPTRVLSPGRNTVTLNDCSISFALDEKGKASLRYGDVRVRSHDHEVYIGGRLWARQGKLTYTPHELQVIDLRLGNVIYILQVRARGFGQPHNHPYDDEKLVVNSTVVRWFDEDVAVL